MEFLWKYAVTLQPKTHAHKLVKAYYTNLSRQRVCLHELNDPLKMCPRCGCLWQESDYKLKVWPRRMAYKSKTRKLIKKYDKEKQQRRQELKFSILSKKQRKRAQWLKKRLTDHLEVKCQQCNNEVQIPLKYSTSDSKEEIQKITNSETDLCKMKKKTKRKKKKKVKINAKNSEAINEILKSEKQPHKSSTINSKNVEKSNHKAIKKQQQQNFKAKHTKTSNGKIKSKAQVKHSLVQLAQVLKKLSASGTNETTVNKSLQTLLK